jgi:hypothetical protein
MAKTSNKVSRWLNEKLTSRPENGKHLNGARARTRPPTEATSAHLYNLIQGLKAIIWEGLLVRLPLIKDEV